MTAYVLVGQAVPLYVTVFDVLVAQFAGLVGVGAVYVHVELALREPVE